MNFKPYFIVLLVYLIGFKVYADEAPHDMHELLLRYNLAAHVKISSHGKDHFRVKVLDVLDRRKSGIVKGDYLKIPYDFNIACPPAFPKDYAEDHREALVFLTYSNGRWWITQGVIAFVEDSMASVYFHQENHQYKAPISNWEANLREYDNHFSEDEKGRLILKHNEEDFLKGNLGALTQLQYVDYFHKAYQSLTKFKYLHQLEFPEEFEEENTPVKSKDLDRVYNFAQTYPITDSMMLEINMQLNAFIEKDHSELKKIEIDRKSYYSLLFEKNGEVSAVETLKSAHLLVDKTVKSYFSKNKLWRPALNTEGNPVRFKQTIVFIMK